MKFADSVRILDARKIKYNFFFSLYITGKNCLKSVISRHFLAYRVGIFILIVNVVNSPLKLKRYIFQKNRKYKDWPDSLLFAVNGLVYYWIASVVLAHALATRVETCANIKCIIKYMFEQILTSCKIMSETHFLGV